MPTQEEVKQHMTNLKLFETQKKKTARKTAKTKSPLSSISILFILAISIFKQDLFQNNWRYLCSLFLLLISQVVLGVLSLRTNLSEPLFVIGHQLNASLLIATLTSLIFRNPYLNKKINQPFNSVIVGFNS